MLKIQKCAMDVSNMLHGEDAAAAADAEQWEADHYKDAVEFSDDGDCFDPRVM